MLVSVVPIGNSHGIRLPKLVLDRFAIRDRLEMEVIEDGILLKPVSKVPRQNWDAAFKEMHKNGEDVLEEFPDSENFKWEW